MTASAAGSYEQILYPGATYPQSHPARMATLGRLYGLHPVEVSTCRVLELGCGSGENLLPLALQFPDARFHGIDLSPAHVALANQSIAALALQNLTVDQADIAALPGRLPEYDYLIAHGVYSWVPSEVRDALLQLCRQHLAPNGIAYLSYNVNPGWRLRGIVRDALLFHLEGVQEPRERMQQARALLDFMCAAITDDNTGYRQLYAEVVATLDSEEMLSSYLFHDILNEHNQPLYVTQFVAHAREHQLRFLAETDLPDMSPELLGAKATETLAGVGDDVVKREQYMDLLRNRAFRQTLLCHGERMPCVRPDPGSLSTMFVGFPPQGQADGAVLSSTGACVVQDAAGRPREVGSPIVRAALAELAGQWPRALAFAELAVAARAGVADGRLVVQPAARFERDEQSLREGVLELARLGVLELGVCSPPLVAEVSQRPRASSWARFRIAAGLPFCNLRNHPIEFADFTLRLIALLDGKRDFDALTEALLQVIAGEELVVCEQGRRLNCESELRPVIVARLVEQLAQLAEHGMLEA